MRKLNREYEFEGKIHGAKFEKIKSLDDAVSNLKSRGFEVEDV